MTQQQKAHIISAQMTLEVANEPVMGPEGMEDSTTSFIIMKVRNSEPGLMTIEPHNIEDTNFQRWTKEGETPNLKTPRFELNLKMDDAVMVDPDSPMLMVWEAILEHRKASPDCKYGANCPTINRLIQTVRDWFKMEANPFDKVESDAIRDYDRVVRIATGSQW